MGGFWGPLYYNYNKELKFGVSASGRGVLRVTRVLVGFYICRACPLFDPFCPHLLFFLRLFGCAYPSVKASKASVLCNDTVKRQSMKHKGPAG